LEQKIELRIEHTGALLMVTAAKDVATLLRPCYADRPLTSAPQMRGRVNPITEFSTRPNETTLMLGCDQIAIRHYGDVKAFIERFRRVCDRAGVTLMVDGSRRQPEPLKLVTLNFDISVSLNSEQGDEDEGDDFIEISGHVDTATYKLGQFEWQANGFSRHATCGPDGVMGYRLTRADCHHTRGLLGVMDLFEMRCCAAAPTAAFKWGYYKYDPMAPGPPVVWDGAEPPHPTGLQSRFTIQLYSDEENDEEDAAEA
jgi:hypothetical protein